MTSLSSRAYAGVQDLRRMQASLSDAYASTYLRVGDLAWLARHHSHHELSLDIRLWENGEGELIAWTFFHSKGDFNVFVRPGTDDPALLDEMLAVIEEAADRSVEAGDLPFTLSTYGIDPSRSAEDELLAASLERHGFIVAHSQGGVLVRELDPLPESQTPPGYHLAAVGSEAPVIGRVEAQQAVFAPSNLTLEKYERVRRTWPYRGELDRVVVTDNGLVVAFCTAWFDEANASGLLEPVGTHPAHQRRGLAKAVCVDAMRALHDAGARSAQVAFETEAAYRTYRSIGFEPMGYDQVFCRNPPDEEPR